MSVPQFIKVSPALKAKDDQMGVPMRFSESIVVHFHGMPIYLPQYTEVFGNPDNFRRPPGSPVAVAQEEAR